MFEFHELCDGHITPDFNISLILVFTSSNMPGGIRLTLSLKGVHPLKVSNVLQLLYDQSHYHCVQINLGIV